MTAGPILKVHIFRERLAVRCYPSLMDVSPTDMIVGKTPVPPDGYEIVRVDVVVRLRRKGSKAAPLRD